MNKVKKIIYIVTVLCAFFISSKTYAQCTDITMNFQVTNSTCASNGKIKVLLSGNDVSNLQMSDLQLAVEGTVNVSWAHYADTTITNLPAGTYTIKLRAFCSASGEYVVKESSNTVTITSSYLAMVATMGVARPTINCTDSKTGNIPVVITAKTGSSPFTVTITSAPSTYTGATTLTYTRTNINSAYTINIDDLPAGNYTFTVADACSYSQTFNTTVGTMTSTYKSEMFIQYVYPPINTNSYTSPDCNTIRIQRTLSASWSTDEKYYFYTNSSEYFEVGVQPNGTGTVDWFSSDSLINAYFHYTLPFTIKEMRENNYYLRMYIRTKDHNCQTAVRDVHIFPIPNVITNSNDMTCNNYTLIYSLYSGNYYGTLCFPYRYKIVNSDGTDITGFDWSPWKYQDDLKDTIPDVPYGAKMTFESYDGYSWEKTLISQPNITIGNSFGPFYYYGTKTVNGYEYFNSYMYICLNNADSFPVGTKVEFVSGPKTPPQTTIITTSAYRNYVQPYSAVLTPDWQYMPSGIYTFNITLPGVGCQTYTRSIYYNNYRIGELPAYSMEEKCDGLYITPTKGLIQYETYNGTIIDHKTYFRIYSYPSGAPVDQTPVLKGNEIRLPSEGRYIIAMQVGTTSNYTPATIRDTIYYVKTPFTLDPNKTAAHLCQGSTTGYIHVKGEGGSGNYSYELYDGGTLVSTNTTGIFNYGVAGATYTIKLKDVDCNTAYEQDVTLVDLGIAQLAYCSNGNLCCLTDSIQLKCLTLGETTYTWSGDEITASNKNHKIQKFLPQM